MPVEHSFVAGGIRVHNCFACRVSRDAIQTVREKEGLDFHSAIEKLEKDYGLPPLPWEDGDREQQPVDPVSEILDAPYVDPVQQRCEKILRALTIERTEPLSKVLRLWEAFDLARMLEASGDEVPMQRLFSVLTRRGLQ
jgi:hypothetical protein